MFKRQGAGRGRKKMKYDPFLKPGETPKTPHVGLARRRNVGFTKLPGTKGSMGAASARSTASKRKSSTATARRKSSTATARRKSSTATPRRKSGTAKAKRKSATASAKRKSGSGSAKRKSATASARRSTGADWLDDDDEYPEYFVDTAGERAAAAARGEAMEVDDDVDEDDDVFPSTSETAVAASESALAFIDPTTGLPFPRTKLLEDDYYWDKDGVLGEGSFGKVIKVNDKKTGEWLALKWIEDIDETEQRTKFAQREVSIMGKLNHKNIAKLKNAFLMEKTEVILIMELAKESLYSFIRKSNATRDEKRLIMREILQGLEYIHSMNVVHRDMKPENVLVTEDGRVLITDFGVARDIDVVPADGKKRRYSFVGTRSYVAPEMLLDIRDYGPEVDMWSAALIACDLWKSHPIKYYGKKGTLDQLCHLQMLCGDIDDTMWRENDMPKGNLRITRRVFTKATKGDEDATDFLDQMVVMNRFARPKAVDMLKHAFLTRNPETIPERLYEGLPKEDWV